MKRPGSDSSSLSASTSILSVDTSTNVCSVALHVNGLLVANLETYSENSHSENLVLMIDQVCKLSGIPLEQINAFALSQGPGSYTGLRIGCSTLKGLCFSLDKPLIAISTLQVMAFGLMSYAGTEDLICPMIDARRMEVYQGIYNAKGKLIEKEFPLIIDQESYHSLLNNHRIIFAGNGAAKFKKLSNHKNAIFIEDYHPLAKNMGQLAYMAYSEGNYVDLAYFEPEYLKEFYTSAQTFS